MAFLQPEFEKPTSALKEVREQLLNTYIQVNQLEVELLTLSGRSTYTHVRKLRTKILRKVQKDYEVMSGKIQH